MNVLVVSGIWPPDVGGPASHAPEVAAFLASRGHGIEVVTTAERAPAREEYPVHWVSRGLPPGIRHVRGAALVAGRARRAGIVYTTGMEGRSAVGSLVARTPFVLKLTSDPAFERARRRGHHAGTIDTFQSERGLLTAVRNAEVRRAAHVVTPSAYLAELARGWGARNVTVLPNPAPPVGALRPRDVLRAELGVDGPTLAFAGRLTRQKSLEVALDALALVPGVELLVAGEGDERAELERRAAGLGRVRFLGPLSRTGVLELFHAADAAVLPSRWENFPHTVVEALAVGTPVVATRTGGVEEIVEDGRNGLLVPAGDPEALAAALRRLPAEGERLRAAAAPSVERFAAERVYGELERILEGAAR